MNGPHNPWVRVIVTIFLGAVALQLLVDVVRPLLPYIVAVALLIGVLWAARWWRDRW